MVVSLVVSFSFISVYLKREDLGNERSGIAFFLSSLSYFNDHLGQLSSFSKTTREEKGKGRYVLVLFISPSPRFCLSYERVGGIRSPEREKNVK